MSIFSTLFGPIVVLWIGALVFYISDRFLPPARDRGAAESVTLFLAVISMFGARAHLDLPIPLSEIALVPQGTSLSSFVVVEQTTWRLALLLLGSMLATSLASGETGVDGRAGRLVAIGAALLFLFSGDWGTMALSWVLVDAGLIYAFGQTQNNLALKRAGFLSLSGATILGVAFLLQQQAASQSLVASLAIGAVALRLLPFPLPAWPAVAEQSDGPARQLYDRMIIFVIPTCLSIVLGIRLAQRPALALDARWIGWLGFGAGAGMVAYALKAWNARSPEELIAMLRGYGVSCVLLAVGLGLPATWQLIAGVSVVWSIVVLSLSWRQCQYLAVHRVHSYWRALPAGLAILTLAGAPLTVGLAARVAVYWTIFDDQRWVLMLLVMISEALFVGALLRILLGIEGGTAPDAAHWQAFLALWQTSGPNPTSRRRAIVHWVKTTLAGQIDWRLAAGYAGALGLAIGLVVLGIAPGLLSVDGAAQGMKHWFALPRLPVWAALLLPVVGGVVIYRQQDAVVSLVQTWWPLSERIFALDWLYRTVEKAVGQLRALVWGATRVVEGAGYMAWVLLACLVMLLFIVSRRV